MNFESFYTGIAIGICTGLMGLILLFLKHVRKRGSGTEMPRKIRYNFYLLRKQYRELLNEAKQSIVKSNETTNFLQKMNALSAAKKITLRGLNFFPDNHEGETLLYEITKRKKDSIINHCNLIRQTLQIKKSKCSLKRFQTQITETLVQIRKLEKTFPHNHLWKDFYIEMYLEYIRVRLTRTIQDGNRSALRHHYKAAIKQYRAALKFIQSLTKDQKKQFQKLEKKLIRINQRINKRYGRSQLKKAA